MSDILSGGNSVIWSETKCFDEITITNLVTPAEESILNVAKWN